MAELKEPVTYTVTITDAGCEAGITSAREAYNAGLDLAEGQAVEDHADHLASNQDYVQFVMGRAAEDYCGKFGHAG